MFDIFAAFDFKNRTQLKDTDNPFLRLSNYKDIEFHTTEINLPHSKIFYLDRTREDRSYYFNQDLHVFVFGTVFSNKAYASKYNAGLKIFNPQDIYDLYKKFSKDIVNYIKGSFVLILYEQLKNRILLMSSRLNTLPLFYHYKDDYFIISSSIKAIIKSPFLTAQIDKRALLERILFNHTLGSNTFFENLYQIGPATIAEAGNGGLKEERYWSAERLFGKRVLSEDEALEQCLGLMTENTNLYASDTDKFLLSLTGGFDGRLNLALLDRKPEDFMCYSYGIPGSRQIRIPQVISEKLDINYKPIYLDKEFEQHYEEYALKAIEFSDGTAPFLRANFPYAFEQLSRFSRVNIAGLFGSEIIKPIYRANEQISQAEIDLFMNNNFDEEFKEVLAKIKKTRYLKPDIIDKYAEGIREQLKKDYIQRLKPFDKITQLYIFLLEETIRKYFMQEIRIERYCVETRTPYFDDDFLELIFRTPFAGIYKGALKKMPFSRRKSQEFYAKIIKRTKPILGEIITDRNYKPYDLFLPLIIKYFRIGPLYLKERIRGYLKGNDTFKSLQWPKGIVEKYIYKIGEEDSFFTDRLMDGLKDNLHLKGDPRFFSIFSLRLWLYLNFK